MSRKAQGALLIEILVAPRFAYEAFHHFTLSSLTPKTLEEGPFDGSHTVCHPPSLFTMLLKAYMK